MAGLIFLWQQPTSGGYNGPGSEAAEELRRRPRPLPFHQTTMGIALLACGSQAGIGLQGKGLKQ